VDGGYTVSDPLAMEYSEKNSAASLIKQALILLEDTESCELHALGASGADASEKVAHASGTIASERRMNM
jgi:hypothetical protein